MLYSLTNTENMWIQAASKLKLKNSRACGKYIHAMSGKECTYIRGKKETMGPESALGSITANVG